MLTYHQLRAQSRDPTEMWLGSRRNVARINMIRITADAERDWQLRMQEPRQDLETRTLERAMKAGDAAVKSSKHVSKKRERVRT